MARRLLTFCCLAWLALVISSCGDERSATQRLDRVKRDFPRIREDGVLRVLFTYNSTGYFIYRGEVMGFEFRLLRAFAKDHGMDLEQVVVHDRRDLFDLLHSGTGDVIASRLLLSEVRRGNQLWALPTRPLYHTPPALVQQVDGLSDPQLPEPVEDAVEEVNGGEVGASETGERRQQERLPETVTELSARLVTQPAELADKTVHLDRGSSYFRRLAEIEDAIRGDIRVVELEEQASAEAAIKEVATGLPRYTVAPENIADLQEEYYSNIVVIPTLGRAESVVWGVRLGSPKLQQALNDWLAANPERIEREYQTYFEDREAFRERTVSEYLSSETGQLSQYDTMIRKHARDLGWDWRLLASQAFQESRFDPMAESWAGAVGILQIMPRTAEEVGVKNREDPEENLAGAVRYLEKLDRYWRRYLPDISERERLKFILGSYNAGFAHIQDARRLAEKNGGDPDTWTDVAYWLLKLSEEQYYTDPVVHYGFVRGLEPVTYVGLILERYEHYLDFVDADGDDDVAQQVDAA